MGVPYVCKHCYKGYTKITEHWCKYVCNVCYDQDCYKNKGRDVYCDECRRFCHSSYCFEKHKQQFPRRASGMLITPCDVTKYCRDWNRRYDVCVETPSHIDVHQHHVTTVNRGWHPKLYINVTYSLSKNKIRITTSSSLTSRHGLKMENTQLILHAPLPAMVLNLQLRDPIVWIVF